MGWPDDPSTDPPYAFTCEECRWCVGIGLDDYAVCFIEQAMHDDIERLSAVFWDQAACPKFERKSAMNGWRGLEKP